MDDDKPLKGCVIVLDNDSLMSPADTKKLEDAGAILVSVKPGTRANFIFASEGKQ